MRILLTFGVLTLLVLAFAPAPAAAAHHGLPHCVNAVPAASSASYDVGRIRAEGYAFGSVGFLDLRLVDTVSPAPVPDVFTPKGPAPVVAEHQMAAALVSLQFPGLQNTFLYGGAPWSEVAERAFPLTTGPTVTHSGAQALNMVFNGRITVWATETFQCSSSTQSNLIWTVGIQKIRLDGYATAVTTLDNGVQEPWGTALSIQVSPGSTANL